MNIILNSSKNFNCFQILERIRHAYKSKLANAISYFQKLSDVSIGKDLFPILLFSRQDQKRYFVTEIEGLNGKLKKKNITSNSNEYIRELQRKITEQEIKIKNLTDELQENIEKSKVNREILNKFLKIFIYLVD